VANRYSANLQVMFKLYSVKSYIVNVYPINVCKEYCCYISMETTWQKSIRLLKQPRDKDLLDAEKMKGRLECISKELQERAYSLRYC
jgi:hypothetical protein